MLEQKSIPTLYSSLTQLLLDLKIFNKIASIPQLSIEEQKENLYKEFQKQKPMPTMEMERYKLSNIVSSDYKVTYDKELELQDFESLMDFDNNVKELPVFEPEFIPDEIVQLFSYNNKVKDTDRQAIIDKYDLATGQEYKGNAEQKFGTLEQSQTVITEDEIDDLFSNEGADLTPIDEGAQQTLTFDMPFIDNFDVLNSAMQEQQDYLQENTEESTNEEVIEQPKVDFSNPYASLTVQQLQQEKGINIEDNTSTEIDEDEDEEDFGYDDEDEEDFGYDDEDDEDDEDFEEDDDFEDEDDEDFEEEPNQRVKPQQTPSETDDEDDEDFGYDDEDEEDFEEDEGFEDEDEEEESYEEEDDEEESYEEEDDEDFDDEPEEDGEDDFEDEEEDDFGYDEEEDEDFEDEDDEEPTVNQPTSQPEPQEDEFLIDDTVIEVPHYTKETKPKNKDKPAKTQSKSPPVVEIDTSDVDIDFTTSVVEKPTPPIQKVVKEEPKPVQQQEEHPTDLRQFIRQHPRCEYAEALKYFSEKEIKKAIISGKVIKKGNILRI